MNSQIYLLVKITKSDQKKACNDVKMSGEKSALLRRPDVLDVGLIPFHSVLFIHATASCSKLVTPGKQGPRH